MTCIILYKINTNIDGDVLTAVTPPIVICKKYIIIFFNFYFCFFSFRVLTSLSSLSFFCRIVQFVAQRKRTSFL